MGFLAKASKTGETVYADLFLSAYLHVLQKR